MKLDAKRLDEREEKIRNAIENLGMAAEMTVSGAQAMTHAQESLEILRLARLGLEYEALMTALATMGPDEDIWARVKRMESMRRVDILAALPKEGVCD